MQSLDSPETTWPLWIDGRADSNTQRTTSKVVSPIDAAVTGLVEQAGEDDIERTVQSALTVSAKSAVAPAHVRAAWLRDAAGAFDAHVEVFIESLVRIIGKPRRLAAIEARRGSDLLRRCAEELSSLGGETLPLDAVPGGENRLGMTWREPLGVVAAITPFNAPINLMLQKVAPALAMGNAVIIKPAPETAIVTLQIAEALAPALPDGLLSVLCGGPDVALGLARHDDVAAVSLTGGTTAGEAVLREAGIKPVLLELGSNSPNLVLAGADLADAATRIAAAAFSASGQQCISAQRVIVEASMLEKFVEHFVEASQALVVGDPASEKTDIGPLIHERSRDRIRKLIEDAERHGGKILLDGRSDSLYFGPTVVLDPYQEAALLREEVFGPVAVILTASSFDHAIEIANSVDLGLQASCFTSDIDVALTAARRLRAGSVWINEATRFRLDIYPFGGVGRSGLGREGVRYAMEELSQLKFVGVRTQQP